MKKAMKFAWMVLLALPLIALPSCSKDDEPQVTVQPTITVSDIDYTLNVDDQSALLTFEITNANFEEGAVLNWDCTVTPVATITKEEGLNDEGKYTVELSDLQLGKEYTVTINAEIGDIVVDKTVKFLFPLFKDYSPLLGMTSPEVVAFMGGEPDEADPEEGTQDYYFGVRNVEYVVIDYSEETDEDVYEISEEVQTVRTALTSDLPSIEIDKYLETIYKSAPEYSTDVFYAYTGKNVLVYYQPADPTADIDVNLVQYFPFETPADALRIRAAMKANRDKIIEHAKKVKARMAK